MSLCPTCELPVPAESTLTLVDVLARLPGGAATETLARTLHRRSADVRAELRALAEAGVVERLPAAGRSHAQRWRLEPPGRASDSRQELHPAKTDVAPPEPAADVSGPHSAPRVVSERIAAGGLLAIIVLALTAGAATALLLERWLSG